jgi:hypothetical protein
MVGPGETFSYSVSTTVCLHITPILTDISCSRTLTHKAHAALPTTERAHLPVLATPACLVACRACACAWSAGLRSEKDQAVLAQLAACPNVCLIASSDHVNAQLLWTTATAAMFRQVLTQARTHAGRALPDHATKGCHCAILNKQRHGPISHQGGS